MRKIVPSGAPARAPRVEPAAPAAPERKPLGKAEIKAYQRGATIRDLVSSTGWSFGRVHAHLHAAGVLRPWGRKRITAA